jgi:hypothetical protein
VSDISDFAASGPFAGERRAMAQILGAPPAPEKAGVGVGAEVEAVWGSWAAGVAGVAGASTAPTTPVPPVPPVPPAPPLPRPRPDPDGG